MKTARRRWLANLDSPIRVGALACVVATLSYVVPLLLGELMLHPLTIWPFWPGCALLVSVLLLVHQRLWPVLTFAAFAGFVVYDLQAGVPLRSIAWFIPADTVQVLIAAIGLRYFFDGVPRLNGVKELVQYWLIAVILAPSAAATLSAFGIGADYWSSWKVSFFSEVLAFVTLPPFIFAWLSERSQWARSPRGHRLEGAGLIGGLIGLGYLTFGASGKMSPAMLYALIPFLLWSVLRFGSLGISTSVMVVTVLSIWGAVHGRGPFSEQGWAGSMFSLQAFMVSAAAPFMVLAAVVEHRKLAFRELTLANDRLRLALEVGNSVGWEWDIATGQNRWFGDLQTMFGIAADKYLGNVGEFRKYVHPDDRELMSAAVADAKDNHKPYVAEFRLVRSDGTVRWISAKGGFQYSGSGDAERMVGMALDFTERKQANERLRESEERFRLIANTAPVLLWTTDADGRCDYLNKSWLEFTGCTPESQMGNGWSEGIHREDVERCLSTYRSALTVRAPFEMEYRLRRFDGEYCWVFDVGVPRVGPDGSFVGYVGCSIDLTDRKTAENALSNLSGRLIAAQEEERSRIAREIHDDYQQRMALIANELDRLRENIGDPSTETGQRCRGLWNEISELAADLHSLSHRLHSSTLQTLGLVAGVRAFCGEFEAQHELQISFGEANVPPGIPPDVALCLFRVAQEALRNVKKHSGSGRAEVKLEWTGERLHLSVADHGSGFEPTLRSPLNGIGLRSIEERLRLVGGVLEVHSQRSRGTTVHAFVPFKVAVHAAN